MPTDPAPTLAAKIDAVAAAHQALHDRHAAELRKADWKLWPTTTPPPRSPLMTRPAKPCTHQPCPELQPCPTHPRNGWKRRQLPGNWRTIRRAVLARDHWQCQIAGQTGATCQIAADEVDHINNPDDHTMSNLQAACAPCHRAKTTAEALAARRRQP